MYAIDHMDTFAIIGTLALVACVSGLLLYRPPSVWFSGRRVVTGGNILVLLYVLYVAYAVWEYTTCHYEWCTLLWWYAALWPVGGVIIGVLWYSGLIASFFWDTFFMSEASIALISVVFTLLNCFVLWKFGNWCERVFRRLRRTNDDATFPGTE